MPRIDPSTVRVATRGTSRAINRQIVLDLVRAHQPISRADLARAMNVARGAVTTLVNRLIDEDLLVEGATDSSTTQRGRKPTFLHGNASRRVVVAVDLRVSESYVLLADLMGRPVADVVAFETLREPRALARRIAKIIDALREAHAPGLGCEGVGVVVPGMVDRATSRVINAPTLGWKDRDIRTPIATATGLPVQIENSGRACALAQLWAVRKELPSRGDFVFVSVSDGLGVGVVVNGEFRGRHNIAGEFGHAAQHDGPICACGATDAGGFSNRATVARYLRRPVDHIAVDATTAPVSIAEVMAAAQAGDARAMAAVQTTARYLGWPRLDRQRPRSRPRLHRRRTHAGVGCHRRHGQVGLASVLTQAAACRVARGVATGVAAPAGRRRSSRTGFIHGVACSAAPARSLGSRSPAGTRSGARGRRRVCDDATRFHRTRIQTMSTTLLPISPTTGIVRDTASTKGRTRTVSPELCASRHLHYGRIILDATDAPLTIETAGHETGFVCMKGAATLAVAGGQTYAVTPYDTLYVPRQSTVVVTPGEGGCDIAEIRRRSNAPSRAVREVRRCAPGRGPALQGRRPGRQARAQHPHRQERRVGPHPLRHHLQRARQLDVVAAA
jgi:predicted NBD/HSP70 family sugar kinase